MKVLHAEKALSVKIIEDHSNVLVRRVSLENLTRLAAKKLSSVKLTTIVQKLRNAFKRMEFQSVAMFVRASLVALTLNANLKIMQLSVIVVTATKETRKIVLTAVNLSQLHAKRTLNVPMTLIAMVSLANRLVHPIQNVLRKKLV